MATRQSVGAKLKALRERAAMTVREVADALGEPRSTYFYYEDRFKYPHLPIRLVQRLAQVFVGQGTPPITTEEIAELGGVMAVEIMPGSASDMLDALPASALVERLHEVHAKAINIWLEHYAEQDDAPNEARRLRDEARAIRHQLLRRYLLAG